MYIDIILFAILAAVLATNLYKILGKKTISEDFSRNEKIEKDNKIFSNEVMDYSEKQIVDLDKDFSFSIFLEGAKKAFSLIVNAYKNKSIEEVKDLLSTEVYDNFKKSISTVTKKEDKIESFQILSLKASIVNVEVIEKLAKIKIEFSSLQETLFNSKSKTSIEQIDIWILEREMDSKSMIWKLVEVSAK